MMKQYIVVLNADSIGDTVSKGSGDRASRMGRYGSKKIRIAKAKRRKKRGMKCHT